MSAATVTVTRPADLAPGRMKRLEIDGRRILLVNHEGTYYALDDTCSHEDASLYLGCLDGELIKCPLHGSRFNIKTGQPMEEPADEPVRTYPVHQDTDGLRIELS